MGCGASRSSVIDNRLTTEDREWITSTIASNKPTEPRVHTLKSTDIAIQTEIIEEKVSQAKFSDISVQTEEVDNIKVSEVSVQTEEQEREASQEEYFEEEGHEDDDNLDIFSKELLQNIVLENVETYDDYGYSDGDSENEDGEQNSGRDEIIPFDDDDDDEGLRDCPEEENKKDKPTIEQFKPNYAMFPSHTTLRQENARYVGWKERHPDSGDLRPGYPEPDTTRKSDILKNEDFVALDQYVLKTPSDYLDKPLAELVTYLTKDCKKDVETVRALFRWCCAQDLSQLTGAEGIDTTRQLLMKIKNKNGYDINAMFDEMCSLSSQEHTIVRGTTKAAGYQLGQEIDFHKHAYSTWIAVKISGKWRLIDVNFASRSQTGGDHGEWALIDDNGQGYKQVEVAPVGITYQMDEFYFLTDPDEFIYNHFPHDEGWQLLARPVTKDEFQKMAYLRPSFFTMGMDIRQAKRCVTHAPSGESIFHFGLPADEKRLFMYRLWKSTKDGNMKFETDDKKLVQYVYMEQIKTTLTTKVMFPITGKYRLELFIKDASLSDNKYSCSSIHLLLCTKANDVGALPSNPRHIWGPSEDMKEFGIFADNWKHGTVETENGEAEMVFSCKQELEMIVQLKSEHKQEKELTQWVLWRMVDGKIIINLRMLEAGRYALEIYAKKKGVEGPFSHISTYLVNVSTGMTKKIKFPEVANQKAGENNNNSKYQLEPISHKQAYFTSSTGQETITMGHALSLKFLFKMQLQQADESAQELEGYTFYSQTPGQLKLQVRFPRSGLYGLDIYAKEDGSDGSYICAFTYIVHVPIQMGNCKKFPKQYRWDMGCSVEGLSEGELQDRTEVKVKAIVPNAASVAVKGKDWTHLKQDESGVWVGDVNTGEADETIDLLANFGDGNQYETLAQYEVKSNQELSAKRNEEEKALKLQKEKLKQEEEDRRKYEKDVAALERELKAAIMSKDVKRLKVVVAKVDEMSCTNRVRKDYNTARNLIKSLERMERLKKAIMKMDQSAMAEIRSYNTPPRPVHDIMSAALLLLRKTELETKDWAACKVLLNTNTLKKNVRNFNLTSTNTEIASRCLRMVQPYKLEDISETSAVTACFYAWTVGMSEELNVLTKGQVLKSKPAKVKRQKEIFSESV